MAEYFNKKGISTIELLLACALITLCLSSVVILIFQSQNIIAKTPTVLEEITRARNILDGYRFVALNTFSSIVSATSTVVVNRNEFTKDVLIHGYLDTTVVDPGGAIGGSTCMIKDWNTTHLGGTISIVQSIPTDLDARDGYIYIAVDPAISTSSDLYIVDARDRDHPVIISSLDTGPGLVAVHVAGKYAYVANTSINSQLQIIDISDPYSPHIVSSYKLPGTYNDGTTIGNSILFFKSHAYLGTPKSQIAELHDIDVSDPAVPREVASWEASAAINALAIFPPYLFVATPRSEEISVLDISHGLAMVGSFDAPGGSGNGKSLAFHNDQLFLGRTVGGNELYVLGTTGLPGFSQSFFQNINASIGAVLASGNILFLGTSDSQKELQIWNAGTSSLSFLASENFPAKVISLDCDQEVLYALLESSDALRIIYSS